MDILYTIFIFLILIGLVCWQVYKVIQVWKRRKLLKTLAAEKGLDFRNYPKYAWLKSFGLYYVPKNVISGNYRGHEIETTDWYRIPRTRGVGWYAVTRIKIDGQPINFKTGMRVWEVDGTPLEPEEIFTKIDVYIDGFK